MHVITVYSTSNCPFCKQLKQYLDTQGLRYTEIDVSGSFDAREELKKKSGTLSVPVIDINGTIIIGFDVPKIEAVLDGKLSK